MLDRSREAIKPPDEHRPKLPAPGRAHEPVEGRSPFLGAREAPVDELLDDVPPSLSNMRTERAQLSLGVLAVGTDTGIESDVHGNSLEVQWWRSCRSYHWSRWPPRTAKTHDRYQRRSGSVHGWPASR